MIFSHERLAATAGVNPWLLRDKLAVGNPAEIANLAKAFADASNDARLATDLAKEASELTAQGYTVDKSPVHEPERHIEDTKRRLGSNGEDMAKIARILDFISDELESRISHAKADVSALEADIRAIQDQWSDYKHKNRNMGNEDLRAVLDGYVHQAVARVSEQGKVIANSVDSYERILASYLKSMADLGYIPPDALDEGPGDINISAEQAKVDGLLTRDSLGEQPPAAEGVDAINEGSRTIELLNQKVAAGHQLTYSERQYMNTWYDTVGADALAKISGYVTDAAPRVPGADPAKLRREVVSPIADGIMTLSRPYVVPGPDLVYTIDPTEKMLPKAIQDLMGTRIGHADEQTGLLCPNKSLYDTKDLSVDGLGRWNGFADLMETSTIEGGSSFTVELGKEAIRVKQDLNAVSANMTDAMRSEMGAPGDFEMLKQQTADTGASDMLEVVGRNEDASARLLLEKQPRQALLGMNWRDEGGAAAVIHGGTDRNPSDGGGTTKQAEAALAVVKEVGSDRDGYLKRMGERVEDAIKDVGVQYMDSFGRNASGESRMSENLTDTLGRKIGPSFELTERDRDLYLQFISGGADDATDFHTKAVAYSHAMLSDAFRHGDPAEVNETLKHVGRLDGAITKANFDYTYDVTDPKEDKEAVAAHRAESVRNTAIKTGISVATTLFAAGVTVGTAGSGAVLIGPTVSLTNSLLTGSANFAFMDDPAPASELPRKRDELFSKDRSEYGTRRDYLITSAAVNAGVVNPADLAQGLTVEDEAGNVILRPLTDLDDSEVKQTLSTAAHRSINAYEAAHHTTSDSGDVDTLSYDNERNNVATGARDPDSPRNSQWSNDDAARRLLYGHNVSEDGRVRAIFEPRVPSNTDRYYQR